MYMKRSDLSGQSLVEVIIGVGVAVLLSVALITTSLITQKTARSARNRTQATKLAQEYIENIRIFRDRNGYDKLVTDIGGKTEVCINVGSVDYANWIKSCAIDGDVVALGKVNFRRKLEFTSPNASRLDVTATVKWDDTSGPQVVVAKTFITKWE